MSGQCLFKTTHNLGDQSVKLVSLEPHVSGIQRGAEPKHQHLEKETNTMSDSCKNGFKCEHTFIDDVAMLQLRKIVTAYCPELVASPDKDLGCHVMYSKIFTFSQMQP